MSSFAPRRNVIVDWNVDAYSPAPAKRARQNRAAQRTRLAWWRWIALLFAAVIFATLQTGCAATSPSQSSEPLSSGAVNEYNYESSNGRRTAAPGGSKMDAKASNAASVSPPKPSPRSGKVAFDAPDDASSNADGVSPETRRLIEQSERDVALLTANRTSAGVNSGSTVPSATTTLNALGAPPTNMPPISAPSKKEIQWNDPPARKNDAPPPAPPKPTIVPPPLNLSPPATAPVSVDVHPPSSQPDAAALRPDRIRQLTVDLARELYAAGAYSEHPLRELTVIAAMGMTEPQRKLDPNAIPDLTEDERVLLAHLQTFFASVGETLDRGSDVNTGVAQAAATLKQALVHEPQLTLPTLALCTRVGGFGDYAPFERNMFLAGGDQKAIVYIEIEDFVSEINQNNEFVTELSQQLTIFSERDGIPVWHEDWQQATDVTRNKRQDFFTTQIITLPKTLSVGKYTLKVRVRDEKSKAESESSLPFELVADAKMLK